MGNREDFLKSICEEKYGKGQHPAPALGALLPDQLSEINRIYKDLGGLLPDAPYKFAKYDIPVKDFIIELDEQEHFNRYRYNTLDSSIYEKCLNFDKVAYMAYCAKYEDKCRTNGKFGSSPSADKQFGKIDSDDLEWSRWKQRAFYDLVKDAYSIAKKLPIIRISIYDEYNGETINDLLKSHKKTKLLAYVEERYKKAKGL
ncbi:MAG: hypothetical protein K2G29_03385 [Muribaculaceae bacterium]|nr:hypothetical protein [Muribaculaceae bacterium]MDE6423231.1 hypothetical protein [Muribaculaceae bacterium]